MKILINDGAKPLDWEPADYFKVINLNAKNPKKRLANKEKLLGIIKPQTETTPPIKKLAK